MKINLKKAVMGSSIMLATGLMFASAHMGGMGSDIDSVKLTARFEQDAKILGVNVSEVKDAWADGKSIFDLAAAKGIATSTIESKIKDIRAAEMKTKMDALVTAGVITQAQADKKIANMKTMQDKMRDGKGKLGKIRDEKKEGGFLKNLFN